VGENTTDHISVTSIAKCLALIKTDCTFVNIYNDTSFKHVILDGYETELAKENENCQLLK